MTSTLRFVAEAGASGNLAAITMTIPSTVRPRHGLLMKWVGINTATFTAPTGFTQVGTDVVAGSNRTSYWKRSARVGDAGLAVTLTMSTLNRQHARLVAYSGVNGADPVDAFTLLDEDVAASTHDVPTTTTVGAGSAVVIGITERSSTVTTNWGPPAGFTERSEGQTSGTGGTDAEFADNLTQVAAGTVVGGGTYTGGATSSVAVVTSAVAIAASASPVVSAVNTTFNDSASATTTGSLTGISDGDYMVALFVSSDTVAGAAINTPPTGWTVIRAHTSFGTASSALYGRFKQSGDANPAWVLAASRDVQVIITGYTGVDPTTPIDLWDVATRVGTVTTTAAPTVTTTGPNRRIVRLYGEKSTTATSITDPASNVRIAASFGNGASSSSALVVDEALASAGATGTATATYNVSSANGVAFTVALNPVALNQDVLPSAIAGAEAFGTALAWADPAVTLNWTAEGGTDGVTVTTGNSGGASGTAWDGVTIGTGGTFIYQDSPTPAVGQLAAEIATAGTSSAVYAEWNSALGTVTGVYMRFYLRLTGTPAAVTTIAAFRSSGTNRVALRLTTAREIRMVVANALNTATTSTSVIPLNQTVMIEARMVGSATHGQTEVRIYLDPDAAVPDEVNSASGLNSGGTGDRVLFGLLTAASSFASMYMDEIAVQTAGGYPARAAKAITATAIGSAEALGTPVVTPGAATVSPTAVGSGEAFGTAVVTTGPVTVSPAAVGSGEAFGTPAVTPGGATVSPSAVASGEVFGAAVITTGAVSVAPSAIGSAEAFGSATVTAGVAQVAPAAIGSAEAFGTAAVTTGGVTVSPSAIGSAEAFGTAAVTAGAVSVSPSAIASAEALGTPVVTSLATVSPSAIASGEAHGTATVTVGAVAVEPSSIGSGEAHGTPTVVLSHAPLDGLVDDFADGSINTALWNASFGVSETGGRIRVPVSTGFEALQSKPVYTLTGGAVLVRVYPPAAGGATTEAHADVFVQSTTAGRDAGFVVDVLSGVLTIALREGYADPGLVVLGLDPVEHAWLRIREDSGDLLWETAPDGATWTTRRTEPTPAWAADGDLSFLLITHRSDGTPDYAEFDNVNVPTRILEPSAIASGEAFGNAIVQLGTDPTQFVEPDAIASGEAFGTAAVTTGAVTVTAAAIGSAEQFGTATVTPGTATIVPAAIASGEAFGTAALTTGGVTVSPAAIAGAETFGTAVVTPGAVTIGPVATGSAEAFGTPTVTPGTATVSPAAIGSAETFGTPTVSSGSATITPAAIGSAEALGVPTVTPGTATLVPQAIDTGETFGTPTIAAGPTTVDAVGIPSAETFGTATVTLSAPDGSVFVSGIPTAEQFGIPTIRFSVPPGRVTGHGRLGTDGTDHGRASTDEADHGRVSTDGTDAGRLTVARR